MAYLSHTHPAFETVYTIEAINEPLQDANLTPGLGRCKFSIIFSRINRNAKSILSTVEKAFVLGICALELTLGIIYDDTLASGFFIDSIALPTFKAAIPIIGKLSEKYGIGPHYQFDADELVSSSRAISVGHLGDLPGGRRQRHCLATQYVCSGLFKVQLTDSACPA